MHTMPPHHPRKHYMVQNLFIGFLWKCQGFHLQNVSIYFCTMWFAIHKGTNYVVPNHPGYYA